MQPADDVPAEQTRIETVSSTIRVSRSQDGLWDRDFRVGPAKGLDAPFKPEGQLDRSSGKAFR